MKLFTNKLFVLSLFLLLFLGSIVSVASAETHVVANSKDWRSIYLLAIYGKYLDVDVVFFNNLIDAQLKTKMIPPNDTMIVFESTKDPVIKKYNSLLKVNGYQDYSSISFNDYSDLQTYLLNELKVSGYFIMDPNYGLDAIAATQFILSKNYFPLFIDADDVADLVKLSNAKPTYIVGRTPVRILDQLSGTKIQGFPYETLQKSIKLSLDTYDGDWGILMRADTVDLDLLVTGLPVFVYHADEYIDELAKTVKDSDISKFEVVGAGTADIAKAIELQSQKNLNFMLKYGRKVTNYPGLEDNILDIDSVSFDYPIESLEIVKSTHYPELGILALTFKNTGNSDVLFFSNVEFAGEPLSDENTHLIYAGEEKTIPFKLSKKGLTGDVVKVTTRYGSSLPLKFSITGEPGTLFYESHVENNDFSQEFFQPILISSGFDTKQGVLEIVFKNPYAEPIELFSELLVGETDVISSKVIRLDPNEKGTLFIEAPYLRDDELLLKQFKLMTYVGPEDTIGTNIVNDLLIEEKSFIDVPMMIFLVVLAFLLFGFFFFVFKRRKNKKDGALNNKSSKKLKKKNSFSGRKTRKTHIR